MWPALIVAYGLGVGITALAVFRNRVFSQGYAVNVGAVVLWPVYWGLFLATFLLNRNGEESK